MKQLQGIVSEIPFAKPSVAPIQQQEIQVNIAFTQRRPIEPQHLIGNISTPKATVQQTPAIKRIKVANRKRFGLTLVIAAFLIATAVFGAIAVIGGKSSLDENIQYIQMSVAQGDTVWELVREANPEYKGDIRKLVDLTKKRNGSVAIVAGTSIEIPVIKEAK